MAEQDLPHLLVVGSAVSFAFQSTLSPRRPAPPERSREAHGNNLLAQLSAVRHQSAPLDRQRAELELPAATGLTLALEIRPKGLLDFTKLEWKRDGVELLSVTEGEEADVAVISIPEGHLSALERRIRVYLDEDRPSGKPKNAALVNAIEGIRRAAFAELWTDDAPPAAAGVVTWYQVWIRAIGPEAPSAYDKFVGLAEKLGISVEPGYVRFPGRVVVAVNSSRAALEKAVELLDVIAEIRTAEITADFFLAELKPHEGAAWIQNLLARTKFGEDDAPYVTLLDTGAAHGHPLLSPAIAASDLHAYDPGWGSSDHHGHGTQMAGICLYGDLTQPLASSEPVFVPHRMESVKMLPPVGQTPPHLWGHVTAECVARAEATAADRTRVFAMMTTATSATRGVPSEWSAVIDELAFGTPSSSGANEDEPEAGSSSVQDQQRLFVLAAGNVGSHEWSDYPDVNLLRDVESPAQAWNALTVGASTSLTHVDANKDAEVTVIASHGALSPSSTTSATWATRWPFKPDVLAEGGNGSIWQDLPASGPESLRVLACCRDFTAVPLTESGDTSAAAAEVARLCAHLAARYPGYWPETIRALVVHGARYTSAMRGTLPVQPLKKDKEVFLRTYGHGLIGPTNSLTSASNRATMVMQERIAPYRLDASAVKLGHMHLHRLPWPKAELEGLGDANVLLRVTLSYFVQPNPSRRGWQSKYRYQSHGLRFAVKSATESETQFLRRINNLQREADSEGAFADADSSAWTFGSQLQAKGSIHSDSWLGFAAQLAAKEEIAVFPVGGWWKDWKEFGRYDVEARYALVVTLEVAADIDVDIYTPIAVAIETPIAIDVPASA